MIADLQENYLQEKCNTAMIYVVWLGLFFSVTNHVYLSAVPATIMLLCFFPLLWQGLQQQSLSDFCSLHQISCYSFIFYFFSLLSLIFYAPESLLNFLFYRYDGNFIISYAAFLFLPFFVYAGNIEKWLKFFVIFASLVNIPFFILFIQQLYGSNPYPYFHTLFSSTNAAGGFLSIVLALTIPLLFEPQTTKSQKVFYLLLIVVLSVLLFFTTSRGSMLGLIAALMVWQLIKFKKNWMIGIILLLVVLIQTGLIFKFYPNYQQDISYLDYQQKIEHSYEDKKEENIYHRLLKNWPIAVDAFVRSPLVGYGFGSVNDLPFENKGQQYSLFDFNPNPIHVFSDAHAHHSYLHILAEQGIFGLVLLLLVWRKIYLFLRTNRQIIWINDGLMLGLWVIIFSSFTEHRITTPSMLIPFSLIFLLYYGKVADMKKSIAQVERTV